MEMSSSILYFIKLDLQTHVLVPIFRCHFLIEIKPLHFVSQETNGGPRDISEIKWNFPVIHTIPVSGRMPVHRLKWENLAEMIVLTTQAAM